MCTADMHGLASCSRGRWIVESHESVNFVIAIIFPKLEISSHEVSECGRNKV